MGQETRKVEEALEILEEVAKKIDMGKVAVKTRLSLMEVCLAIISEAFVKTVIQEENVPRLVLLEEDEPEEKKTSKSGSKVN